MDRRQLLQLRYFTEPGLLYVLLLNPITTLSICTNVLIQLYSIAVGIHHELIISFYLIIHMNQHCLFNDNYTRPKLGTSLALLVRQWS